MAPHMRRLVILLCLVSYFERISAKCGQLWTNDCVDDPDCCQGLFCERPTEYRTGVCKPAPLKNVCHELEYNLCKVDADCCSGFCNRPSSWQFGVCKVKVEKPACYEDNFNQCKWDKDCCSKYCDRPPSWQFGVCKPEEQRGACRELDYNLCKLDKECCSGNCWKEPTWKFGVCKEKEQDSAPAPVAVVEEEELPRPTYSAPPKRETQAKPIRPVETPGGSGGLVGSFPASEEAPAGGERCRELWFNECTTNEGCCSGFCDKGPNQDWRVGVCKPKEEPVKEVCKPLFFNECNLNSDCCSNFCYKGPQEDWRLGVCKNATSSETDKLAGENGGCHKLWFNGCAENAECCSGFCFKGDDDNWAQGVCKPGAGGSSTLEVKPVVKNEEVAYEPVEEYEEEPQPAPTARPKPVDLRKLHNISYLKRYRHSPQA